MFNSFDWFFSDPFFRAPYYYQEPEHSFHLAAHEVENGVEVELEVPRYRAEDIKVTTDVDTGVVTIEGRRAGSRQNVGAHTSTSVPSFKRAFTVAPAFFDLTKLTSKVADGVLTIFVPHKPRESPKRPLSPKSTPIAIAFPPSSEPKAVAAAPQQAGQGGQVVASGHNQVEAHQAGRRGPGQWPPRLSVVQHSAPGVAVTYNVSLPANVVPENVKLQVQEDGLLRVDVSYSFRKESDHGYEEQSGSCTRFLQLPEGTKPEHVRARVENSQLKVDVQEAPKAA